MQAGEIFGGAYKFYRFWGQIKHYHLLGWQTILATRLKLGTGDYFGGNIRNYPLFYRFFIGGEGSVRGWRYWRLGPNTPDDTPLGGLTDLEGSLELRRPIWDKLSGAVFLDFGQVSTHAYDIPIRDLTFPPVPRSATTPRSGPRASTSASRSKSRAIRLNGRYISVSASTSKWKTLKRRTTLVARPQTALAQGLSGSPLLILREG